MTKSMSLVTVAGLVGGLVGGLASADTTVTFDEGPEGWSIQNAVTILETGGNPGAYMEHVQIDTFGVNIANTTSAEFIGDYAEKGAVTLSIDVQVDSIDFFGSPVSRDLVVQFVNNDIEAPSGQVTVWTHVGLMSSGLDWTTFTASIEDPTATELPAGWGGTGDEDPNTFEPVLPAGVTFADVLADVDEVRFTTFVPGFFFGFTNFDFGVDNVSITGATGGPCSAVDYAAPFGELDIADVVEFLRAFGDGAPLADLAAPEGAFDIADVVEFLRQFGAGCP
ncbi:MAG: PEP-CTERM sorting domain-containing protein [Phycisphaerae bacterium]|nr:PEP-CTERM sorting domain-containing protein [Phycisphaerae bacterium]